MPSAAEPVLSLPKGRRRTRRRSSARDIECRPACVLACQDDTTDVTNSVRDGPPALRRAQRRLS
jgi:hypothetical protein